jgi:hypothetical protein
MRTSVLSLIAAAAVVGIAAIGIRPVLTAPNPTTPNPDVRPADADPQPFNPQMGALMNMVIQPRHAKLGLAGQAENWALAGYYFKELKTGFGVVSRAIPRWKGLPVPDLVEASVEPTFAVLDFAIKAGEPRQFAESYGKLTQACNNCHATTDHPFVVIKAPDASTWSNQDFKPGAR